MIRLTPTKLEVLIHYCVNGTVHPCSDTPAVQEAIREFGDAEVIQLREVIALAERKEPV